MCALAPTSKCIGCIVMFVFGFIYGLSFSLSVIKLRGKKYITIFCLKANHKQTSKILEELHKAKLLKSL